MNLANHQNGKKRLLTAFCGDSPDPDPTNLANLIRRVLWPDVDQRWPLLRRSQSSFLAQLGVSRLRRGGAGPPLMACPASKRGREPSTVLGRAA